MDEAKEPGSEEPKLKIVARRKPLRGGAIDRDKYDQLVELYLHGARSYRGLAMASGVSYPTAKKAIEKGWPIHNWGPLRERARLYDKAHAEGQNATSPERAKSAKDWIKMREDLIEIYAGVRIGIAKALRIIVNNVDASVVTKAMQQRQVHYEEVLNEKGDVVRRIPHNMTVDVQQPPATFAIVDALSQITVALDKIGGGELEMLMATPPNMATGKRGHKLTPEQIKYMAENQGKIPPGVSIEDLGG